MLGGRHTRALDTREQRLQQGGLAEAVAADEHDLLAPIHDRAEVGHDRRAAVRLGDARALQGHAPRGTIHVEPDVRPLNVRPRQLGRLQPLDLLAARGDLARTGAGMEPRDEVVQLGDLLFPLLVVAFDPGTNLRLREDHVVVAARVLDDRLVVDVRRVRADGVQEMPVVRNHDQRAFIPHQELAQPVDRVEVEVVGRLVEQQRLRMAEQGLRQQDANLLPALQLAHQPIVEILADIEPLQQHGGIAFRGVPVLLADDAFELAQAHAVLIGQGGLSVEPFALLECAPQPVIAHDHGVDRPVPIERELVLAEHADLRGPGHLPALRRDLAGQQLHEGGLAGPVGPRQAVPPALGKGDGDVLEQDLRAEAHRYGVD